MPLTRKGFILCSTHISWQQFRTIAVLRIMRSYPGSVKECHDWLVMSAKGREKGVVRSIPCITED
jgi:hypothetical protein